MRFKLSVAGELFPDNWPVMATGAARFNTGPPGKVYDASGCLHARIIDDRVVVMSLYLRRRRSGWRYPFGNHRRGFCMQDRKNLTPQIATCHGWLESDNLVTN